MGRQPHEVVGYTYEADYHCVDCTTVRFGWSLKNYGEATDKEGNEVSPLFLGDAQEIMATHRTEYDEQGDYDWSASIVCGTCGKIIEVEPTMIDKEVYLNEAQRYAKVQLGRSLRGSELERFWTVELDREHVNTLIRRAVSRSVAEEE